MISIVFIYNSIIRIKNSAEESKGTIDVVLQNRFDLIPNLIKIVKAFMKHEKMVIENITNIRSSLINDVSMTNERFKKENNLSWTLNSIFAISENYPDLKSNNNFINLQLQLVDTEDQLQAARRWYNAAIKDLRIKKETFPSNIIAKIMTLPSYEMYKASTEARAPIISKIKFN
jgi:LemA protein